MKHYLIALPIVAVLALMALFLSGVFAKPFDSTGAWVPATSSTRSVCLKEAETKARLANADKQAQVDALNKEIGDYTSKLDTDFTPHTTDTMTIAKKAGPAAVQRVKETDAQVLSLQHEIDKSTHEYEAQCK